MTTKRPLASLLLAASLAAGAIAQSATAANIIIVNNNAPGIGFNALSPRALDANRSASLSLSP